MVSDEAKRIIDAMSREELVGELERKNRSRFQGDNFAYLAARLNELDHQAEAQHQQRNVELNQEANRIASGANVLAADANAIAKRASSIAAKSLLVSVFSL